MPSRAGSVPRRAGVSCVHSRSSAAGGGSATLHQLPARGHILAGIGRWDGCQGLLCGKHSDTLPCKIIRKQVTLKKHNVFFGRN